MDGWELCSPSVSDLLARGQPNVVESGDQVDKLRRGQCVGPGEGRGGVLDDADHVLNVGLGLDRVAVEGVMKAVNSLVREAHPAAVEMQACQVHVVVVGDRAVLGIDGFAECAEDGFKHPAARDHLLGSGTMHTHIIHIDGVELAPVDA